jgi:hypothetical protein
MRLLALPALLALALTGAAARAAEASPAELRKEMLEIRQATNWEDPAAAEAAEAKLKVLRRRLLGEDPAAKGTAAPGGAGAAAGTASDGRPDNRGAGGHADMQERIAEGVATGGHTVDLGKTIGEVIDEKLTEDRDATPRNPQVLEQLDTLVLDLSTPEGRGLAARLDAFRGVKRLVVTGGSSGAPIALDPLLALGAALPLEELWVVGFHGYLTSLSPRVAGFRGLRKLGLFGNALSDLPPALGGLSGLEELLIDSNPIATVLPVASRLPRLARLGIGGTRIGAAERATLQKLLPRCRIEP